MNERIREFAEQAWIADCIEQYPEYKKNEMTEYLLQDMEGFHKKFAELIVKECMKLNHDHFSDEDPYTIDEVYRQHFGVEE